MWVIVLSAVTLYVYAAFWWYYVNRELRDLGRARGSVELGDNPTLSVLAVTLGSLVIVPPFVSFANGCKRTQAAQRLAGRPDELNGWLALILYAVTLFGLTLFAPVMFGYLQSELNKVWKTEGMTEGLPGLPHPGYEAPPMVGVPSAPAAAAGAATVAQPVAAQGVAPSWYPDPWGEARLRYWDGHSWTGHRAD